MHSMNCPLLVAAALVLSDNAAMSAADLKSNLSKAASTSGDWLQRWRTENKLWRGVHVMLGSTNAASDLLAELPELAALGVNALVLEINYSFAFESHPELRNPSALTKEQASGLAR